MVCEVVPADSPSKHWFRSGCPAILGDDYQSFLETLKDDSFKGARNRGRCVVPHSPFAQLTTGPERLVPFSRVVRQAEVVEAVRQSFPALDVNYTVMTLATAERFFTAMQSKFSEWKIVKGGERKFVVAGGFMNPTPLPMASGKEPWTEIEFLPLQMGEIEPTHGCQLNDDMEFWRSKEKECEELCKERGLACMGSCVAPFRDALDQEVERDLEVQRLARLEGQTVQVLQKEAFFEAAAVAIVPFTKKMELLIGSIGQVLDVDTHFLTAQVKFPKEVVKFPLEALVTLGKGRKGPKGPRPSHLPSPSLCPVLSSEQRSALSSPRFGQCWSACSAKGFWNSAKAGLKTAATLGSNGAWCYTAPAKQNLQGFTRCVFNFFVGACVFLKFLREFLMLHKSISLSGFNQPVERQLLVLKTLAPRKRQLEIGALCLEDDDCQTLAEDPQPEIWSCSDECTWALMPVLAMYQLWDARGK